jgi:hypothetical protein
MNPIALRSRCRDPKCQCALPLPAEERRAFCARGCYDRFYRTRCKVCAEPSANGRLHAKSCAYAHRQNPELFAYKKLQNPSDGALSPKRISAERNPYKTGIKTRGRTWGPVLSDDDYWLASLPLHTMDAANLKRGSVRAKLEPTMGKPKVLFGPDDPPLNLIGGFRFPNAPDFIF